MLVNIMLWESWQLRLFILLLLLWYVEGPLTAYLDGWWCDLIKFIIKREGCLKTLNCGCAHLLTVQMVPIFRRFTKEGMLILVSCNVCLNLYASIVVNNVSMHYVHSFVWTITFHTYLSFVSYWRYKFIGRYGWHHPLDYLVQEDQSTWSTTVT